MRMSMIAASVLALAAAGDAGAQRMVAPGPGFGGGMHPPVPSMGHAHGASGARWGSNVGGHWWGGMNAPGGWRAYRRPARGWTLPGYWVSPSFAIADWSSYGLGEPPAGYGWSRYYDDAVLTDSQGRVYDSVDGVHWEGGVYAAETGYDDRYAADGYVTGGYPAPDQVQPTYGQSTYSPGGYAATAGYPGGYVPQPGYAPGAGYAPPPAYAQQRNSGVGGALVGGVAGGVAGNLIAGRHHRLEGTLIGAGVGSVAGYAIDRSSTHRVPVAPRDGYDYPPPPPHGRAPGYPAGAGYPVGAGYPPQGSSGVWHSPDGGTTINVTSAGGYAGGSTTVVTVQTAPVVTTTTTQMVEDHVTWSRHRAPHRRWVRPRPRCGC